MKAVGNYTADHHSWSKSTYWAYWDEWDLGDEHANGSSWIYMRSSVGEQRQCIARSMNAQGAELRSNEGTLSISRVLSLGRHGTEQAITRRTKSCRGHLRSAVSFPSLGRQTC